MAQKEITSTSRTIVIIFFSAILFIILIDLLYIMIWHTGLSIFQLSIPVWQFLMLVAIGIPTHELIHGLVFSMYSKNGFRSIRFSIKNFNPYCHFLEPLKAHQFKVVAVAPFFILGLVPVITALIYNILWLAKYGILFTIGAGGDIWIFFMLNRFDKSQKIQDHPEKMGFIVTDES